MEAAAKKKARGPQEAFGADHVLDLECGRRVRITRWSVRKTMTMAKTLTSLMGKVFGAIEAKQDEAKEVRAIDVIGMIPSMIDSCGHDLAYVVVESLTTEDGDLQITIDDVLDVFTIDDFAVVLDCIIQLNLSEKSLGKWGRLFQNLPMIRASAGAPSTT